jgi:hypothetical protein
MVDGFPWCFRAATRISFHRLPMATNTPPLVSIYLLSLGSFVTGVTSDRALFAMVAQKTSTEPTIYACLSAQVLPMMHQLPFCQGRSVHRLFQAKIWCIRYWQHHVLPQLFHYVEPIFSHLMHTTAPLEII